MKIRKIKNSEMYNITLEAPSKMDAEALVPVLEQAIEDHKNGKVWKIGPPQENGIFLVEMGELFTIIMSKDGKIEEFHDRQIVEIKRHMFLKPIPKELQ